MTGAMPSRCTADFSAPLAARPALALGRRAEPAHAPTLAVLGGGYAVAWELEARGPSYRQTAVTYLGAELASEGSTRWVGELTAPALEPLGAGLALTGNTSEGFRVLRLEREGDALRVTSERAWAGGGVAGVAALGTELGLLQRASSGSALEALRVVDGEGAPLGSWSFAPESFEPYLDRDARWPQPLASSPGGALVARVHYGVGLTGGVALDRAEPSGSLQPVARIDLEAGHASGVSLAWNPAARELGVAWSEGVGAEVDSVHFARVTEAGEVLGRATLASTRSPLAPGVQALRWTGEEYALVASLEANELRVLRLDSTGTLRGTTVVVADQGYVGAATARWDEAHRALVLAWLDTRGAGAQAQRLPGGDLSLAQLYVTRVDYPRCAP